jgi:thioredoxin-dependent peroxiredoxin
MNRAIRMGAALFAAGALSWAIGAAPAAEPAVDLKVGDKAPVFTSTDDQGKEWKSSDHIGKKPLVVFFYSADLTGG